ncbi:MAG: cupredoxin domain-containing protein [Anaeromyxobacter sp.]
MNRMLLAVSAAAVLFAATACRAEDHSQHMKSGAAAKPGARVVAVEITDDGVKPDQIQAKAGETVQLAVTRKTDRTCMTHIVQSDLGIDKALPLGQTVTVDVTPRAAGKIKFVCGMGMDLATLVVTK